MTAQKEHNPEARDEVWVYCTDPRYNLYKWIKRKLILPGRTFVPIGLLGGPVPLAYPDELGVAFNCICGQIRFAKKKFNPRTLVFVGHDCGFYENIPLRASIETKKEDLQKIVEMATRRFRGFDSIVAHFGYRSGNEIDFEKVHEQIFSLA